MIGLRQKLYESLLDDEEYILDRADKSVYNDLLNDMNSQFRQEYGHMRNMMRFASGDDNDENMRVNGKEIIYPGRIFNIGDVNSDVHPIKDYFDINTLTAEHIMKVTSKIISDKTICKNLNAGKLVCKLDRIENININIDRKGNAIKYKFLIPDEYFQFDIIFNTYRIIGAKPNNLEIVNTNINAKDGGMLLEVMYNPDLSGLKSNIKKIYIKQPSMFTGNKDFENLFNNILDTSYTADLNGIERKGNIRAIMATLNNTKKYKVNNNLFKIKERAKITDVLNIKNLKDLEYIKYYEFYAGGGYSIKSVQFFKNEECFKKYFGTHYKYYKYTTGKLSDGWIVQITGNE